MKKLLQILGSAAVICCIGALLGTFPDTSQTVKADQPDAVIVTNTPLPVQGTVAATQSGLWNVGITGTPTVNVGNLGAVHLTDNGNPLNVHDVDRPTQQPFSQFIECNLVPEGQGRPQNFCDPGVILPAVPAGKTLVIEDYSGNCEVPTGSVVTLSGFDLFTVSATQVGIFSGAVRGPATLAGTLAATGQTRFVFGRAAKLYAPAGSTLQPTVLSTSTGPTSQGSCMVFLNGYFVNP